jgi:hypothetical protein
VTFLVDTNVVSEFRRGGGADPNVQRWLRSARTDELHISVLVIGEIRRGIWRQRQINPSFADALVLWLDALNARFGGRILPVDDRVAGVWGEFGNVDRTSEVDHLMAATALVHDMTFVTRNVRDIARTGVRTLNPFLAAHR